ncbi:MAG: iron-containing alcohol dehydrogenase, partial [Pseudomonadota bacterium]|nr:iron-containing alcohol dehydrogenase [Pseudomonadota bacterium]
MVQTVHVPLAGREYDVRIGQGLLTNSGAEIAPLLRRKRVAIVTDENVASKHLDDLQSALEASGIASVFHVLPAGEATKSWPHFSNCVDWLLEAKVERNDVVVALGGGVVGDLVGFAAAVLRRGVRFVQMPT